MLFNTPLLIQAAHLPPTFKGTPDEMFVAMVERMKIVSPSGVSFFVVGDAMPASNQGPWLKGGTQWWVFDSELKTYVPLDVSESETKWFQVGSTTPTVNDPPIWLRTTENPTEARPTFGTPIAWYLFDGAVWRDFTSLKDRSVTQAKLYWLANFYAVTSGVNDYAVSFAPTPDNAPFGYGDGINGSFFCIIKFANTNTGPVSLNVNNLSPRPVKKNVNQPIGAGEIVAGSVHLLAYDGENFQIQTPIIPPAAPMPTVPGGIVADSAGLVIQNNSGSPTTTLDIEAQRVTLSTTNGQTFTTYSVSQSIDITIPGLGGLDTTTTPEAVSTWYYVWLVSNGTNVSAVFSASDSSPELPDGYIYTALLGAIYNDSASDLVLEYQTGRRISTEINSFAASGSPGALVPILTAIPPIAKTVFGTGIAPEAAAFTYTEAVISGDGVVGIVRIGGVAETGVKAEGFFEVQVVTPQNVFLEFNGSLSAGGIDVSGFTI